MSGKYGLQDAYKSIIESFIHAGVENDCRVNLVYVDSEDIENEGCGKYCQNADAFLKVDA